jgi:hypothetical protein
MAERGALDSGSQLAAQLAAQQGSAQRGQEAAMQMAAQAEAAKRGALEQAASAAGQMRAQDVGEQSDVARAKDEIARFNLAQRSGAQQQNLGIRQQDVGLRNQQQMYNKQLQQQQFQNQMAKQGMLNQARSAVAGVDQQRAQGAVQASQNRAAGLQGMAKMGLQLAMSDERTKDVKKNSLHDFLDKLNPSEFTYKDDPEQEDRVGIMAQDMELSDLGKNHVVEDEEGIKYVDYGKLLPVLTAAVADLHKRMKKSEGEE